MTKLSKFKECEIEAYNMAINVGHTYFGPLLVCTIPGQLGVCCTVRRKQRKAGLAGFLPVHVNETHVDIMFDFGLTA